MKKLIFMSFFLFVVFAGISTSHATIYNSYEFQPIPTDMGGELNHAFYYSWSMGLNLSPGEVVTGAQLFINPIWDASGDPNNVLFINLLDTPLTLDEILSANLSRERDHQNGYNNDWGGAGPLIAAYNASTVWPGDSVVFNFGYAQLLALNQFILNDNTFGLGFDPDCYFRVRGLTFKVTTAVPEPSSLLLLGSGLVGVAFYFRRRKK